VARLGSVAPNDSMIDLGKNGYRLIETLFQKIPEGQRKTTKSFSEVTWRPDQDSNGEPPEYERYPWINLFGDKLLRLFGLSSNSECHSEMNSVVEEGAHVLCRLTGYNIWAFTLVNRNIWINLKLIEKLVYKFIKVKFKYRKSTPIIVIVIII
jgi:hypothetical protein